jgi:hypothetical protein
MTRRWLLLSMVAVWLAVPLVLGAATYPRWWAWIAPEQTPMTWVQSVVLVLAGACSALVAYVLGRTRAGRTRLWWLLAAGFCALAVDERFALHERVRDGYLAPRGVTVPFLPWVAPGDFLALGVAVVGLAVLPALWRALRRDVASRRALAVGVVLAGIAVLMDSVDPSSWTLTKERVEQTVEEVVELGSGLAFLAAVLLRLLGLLDAHLRPAADVAAAPGDAETAGLEAPSPARGCPVAP